jgi:NAD(P)H-flavin reductase
LVEALRAAGGTWWCDEYEQAWRRLYWFTATLMIDAAEQVTSEPPYIEAVVTDHDRRRPDLAVIRLRTGYPYRFEAGQHATVESPRLPQTWRSYSMANPPGGDGVVEFHVRAKGVGGLSDILVKETRPGDMLRLGPARGDATLARARQGDLLLVAGGTGLAPIKSILGEIGRSPHRPRTSLFIGARSQEDLYDLGFLAVLAEHSSWLRLIFAVSDQRTSQYEAGQLPDVLARFGPWTGCTAFVAGPPGLVTTLRHRLPALGVPTEHIVHEPE